MSGAGAVLITRLGALGDILMTLPAIRLLRRSLPDHRLVWLIEERHAAMLGAYRDVDLLARMGSYGWRRRPLARRTWAEVTGLVRRLRSERFVLAVDLQGLWKSAIWTRLSGAPVRVGLPLDRTREPGSARLMTHRAPSPAGRHVTDLYVETASEVVRLLGGSPVVVDESDLLPLAGDDRRWASEAVGESTGGPLVAVHVGGSWPTKRWPIDRLAALTARLCDNGLQVVLPYAPDEQALVDLVLRGAATKGATAVACTVSQLAALCERATVFVGADSGPYHLARVVGTATVGLFGPTDPGVNGPRSDRDRVRWGKVHCSPCYARQCPTRIECMAAIQVDDVVRDVVELCTERR